MALNLRFPLKNYSVNKSLICFVNLFTAQIPQSLYNKKFNNIPTVGMLGAML